LSQSNKRILSINGGSSSIRFALYRVGEQLECILSGKIYRIGLSGTNLTFSGGPHGKQVSLEVEVPAHTTVATFLIEWLKQEIGLQHISAVGHRVVHGMRHTEPARVSTALLDDLRSIAAYDPEHLPGEIELIEAFRERFPRLPQVACFDTAFHQTLPRAARLLPIPRRFDEMGVQRYGFHGLSYAYLMEMLMQVAGPEVAQGRVVLAHLGSGASIAAVRDGRCIDTSMGFTPTGGLPMGTRSGDLDPGVAWYMMQKEKLSLEQFSHLINHESGLLGMSETSHDMRDLLACESEDVRAAEAIAVFCYQVKKSIGACAAAMGGLDTLVFAGGIGEQAPVVRARICSGLEFLGIEIDKPSNSANADVISTTSGAVTVRVMHTNEELVIARSVCELLGLKNRTIQTKV